MAILPIGLPNLDWLILSRASADALVQGLLAASDVGLVLTKFMLHNPKLKYWRSYSIFILFY
jgi:hypothetical protein